MEHSLPKYIQNGSSKRSCSIDGCPGKHTAKGYCSRHYVRLIRFPSKKGIVEGPMDYNPRAHEPLTQDEFCRIKDFQSSGFSALDTAYEIQKGQKKIEDAYEYLTWYDYQIGYKRNNEE